jgi:hypothetical protein
MSFSEAKEEDVGEGGPIGSSVVKVRLTPVGKTRVGADQSVRPDRSTGSTSGRYHFCTTLQLG